MKHINTQEQYCPQCGKKIKTLTGALSATGDIDDDSPSVGDFALCMNCYAVLRIGKKWKLSLSSLEESEKFGLRQALEKTISVSKRIRAQEALGFAE